MGLSIRGAFSVILHIFELKSRFNFTDRSLIMNRTFIYFLKISDDFQKLYFFNQYSTIFKNYFKNILKIIFSIFLTQHTQHEKLLL